MALKRADFAVFLHGQLQMTTRLSTESVQSTTLSFQSVHDIHGSDCLALGMLRVRNGITDDVLKKHLQNSSSLLVDQTRDTLDTSSTSQTSDCWLRDTLDVITKYLSMTLGASLA